FVDTILLGVQNSGESNVLRELRAVAGVIEECRAAPAGLCQMLSERGDDIFPRGAVVLEDDDIGLGEAEVIDEQIAHTAHVARDGREIVFLPGIVGYSDEQRVPVARVSAGRELQRLRAADADAILAEAR